MLESPRHGTIRTHIHTLGQFGNVSSAIPQMKRPAVRRKSTTVPHLLHKYYISPFSKLGTFYNLSFIGKNPQHVSTEMVGWGGGGGKQEPFP